MRYLTTPLRLSQEQALDGFFIRFSFNSHPEASDFD